MNAAEVRPRSDAIRRYSQCKRRIARVEVFDLTDGGHLEAPDHRISELVPLPCHSNAGSSQGNVEVNISGVLPRYLALERVVPKPASVKEIVGSVRHDVLNCYGSFGS